MIAVISRTEGEGSGAEITLCHLLSHLGANACIIVITAPDSSVAAVAKAKNIPLIELSFIKEKIVPNIRLVEQCLRNLKSVTLVHAWNSKSFEIGWYISKRLGVPLTCTLHDHPNSAYYTSKKRWLMKWISNRSKAAVTVSDTLRGECIRYNYKSPMATIYNGLPDWPHKEKEPTVGGLLIGFLGMNSLVKGFPVIAEWIRKTAGNKQFHWCLFGEVHTQYAAAVDALRKEGFTNFELMGRQKPQHIFDHIDILVHASTAFDCFPTVLLEAARAGKPSIASCLGGAAEIIEQNVSGYIFNPASPAQGMSYLETFLKKKVMVQFSKNARTIYEAKFGVEKMAASYENFWKEHVVENLN